MRQLHIEQLTEEGKKEGNKHNSFAVHLTGQHIPDTKISPEEHRKGRYYHS